MKKFTLLLFILLLSSRVSADDVFGGVISAVGKMSDWLFEADSSYVGNLSYRGEVQYREVMSQEMVTIKSDDGTRVGLRSHLSNAIGPYLYYAPIGFYFGFDVNNPSYHDGEADVERKTMMLDLTVCTQRFNARGYYQRSGGDYTITSMMLPGLSVLENKELSEEMAGMDNMGMTQVEALGAEVAYITNFRRFSLPAAFTGSMKQLRSQGSPMFGFNYHHYRYTNRMADVASLCGMLVMVFNAEEPGTPEEKRELGDMCLDLMSCDMPTRMVMNDYGISLGYSYNWVFARNWLVNATLNFVPSIKSMHISNTDSFGVEVLDGFRYSPLEGYPYTSEDYQRYYDMAYLDKRSVTLDFDANASGAIVWNKGNMFVSLDGSFRYNRWRMSPVSIHSRSWSARLTLGYKFWKN